MAAYGEGWPAILKELKKRLEGYRIGRVHDYVRFTADSPLTSEWEKLYCDANGRLELWMIHREGIPVDETSLDDETKTLVEHNVFIFGFLTHNDEENSTARWTAKLDTLAAGWRAGDNTLGQKCLTMSNLAATESGIVELFVGSIVCHAIVINFQVQEQI